MKTLNSIVQRFPVGHPYYCDSQSIPLKKDGKLYYATFGQRIDEYGNFIHYTMERTDTLIPEGQYQYEFYNSNDNKMWVPRLIGVPGFSNIETHIANYIVNPTSGEFELLGCTAVGLSINLNVPMLANSGGAFHPWMDALVNLSGKILAGGVGAAIPSGGGWIRYETLSLPL